MAQDSRFQQERDLQLLQEIRMTSTLTNKQTNKRAIMTNATTTSNTSTNVTYTRLSTSSSSDGINSPNKTSATRTSIGSGRTTCTRTRSERLSDKFQALLWVGAAYLTIRHTNFFITLFHHPEIFRPCLLVAVLGFSVNVVLVLYLVMYVDKILKIRAPWEVYCPRYGTIRL